MTSLKKRAYDNLRQAVMDVEPGTLFTVRKCAAELELSYTPVREALLQLYNEGLLDLVANVGFSVVEFDMKKIQSIYQSRACVEEYVLPRIVKQLNDDDLLILKTYIQKQKKAMAEKDVNGYTEKDVEFHKYLIDKLQNQQLSEFYSSVRSQYSVGSKKIEKNHSSLPIEEHEEFIRLIEAEKYDEAVQCMNDHTSAAIERMKEGYVQIGI